MASPAINICDNGLGVTVRSRRRQGHMWFWGSPPCPECLDGQIGAQAYPRGIGLGKRLLKKLLALHKRHGKADKIAWHTTITNVASIALAESCGFRFDPKLTDERRKAGAYPSIIWLTKINKRYSTCKPWRS